MEAQQIMADAEARGVRFCNLEFTDVVGMAKAVTVPIQQLPLCLAEGRWFDGAALEGFVRVTENDMYLRPDATTFMIIPWEPARARILCDVLQPDGELFDGDPRARLRHAIAQAQTLGYRYEVSPEIEFFLLQPPGTDPAQVVPFDRGSYFDLGSETVAPFWRELMHTLEAMHIPVESTHHEAADGQYEIDLAPLEVLACADAIMATKQAIKACAARHKLMATFLPKPFSNVNGSGLHIHQRLIRLDSQRNAFADAENGEYGLAPVGLSFIAGLLEHARGMCSIIAPLVNSYKRLVPSFEAPVELNWGHSNQDMLVRVPHLSARGAGDLRIELRSPDPSCNPYLALTVLLASGLDGVIRQLDCPPPDAKTRSRKHPRRDIPSYRLPESLAEALTALEADPLMRAALGALILDEFLDAKWQEWESYRCDVSPWEIQRYLALF